ncbi:MAG: cobamide remodeling phosphodiesterase CbiR [Desulfosarcinaceae bacterium]|nr:cobamide remodeling phosphodiesterase CbiR [Desulfosarcinaceae bacterium]
MATDRRTGSPTGTITNSEHIAAAIGGPGRPLKSRFPFRLGTTSFVYPASWSENAARLAPHLDEIELLFFESRTPGSLPDRGEIDRLAAIAADHAVTYTVHLPVDRDLGAGDAVAQRQAVEALTGIVNRTRPLPVTSFTLHLASPRQSHRRVTDVRRWQDRNRAGLEALLAAEVPPQALSIETLDYPFEWAFALVEEMDLRVCLDIGHLILYASGRSADHVLAEALNRYLDHTTVIHLHGVSDGRDHRPLDELAENLLMLVIDRLVRDRFSASLSLEIFNLEALNRSLACFHTAWKQLAQNR